MRRKRTLVRSVSADGVFESSFPINRWTVAHYLDSQGRDGRLRVYALDGDAIQDFVNVSADKHRKLGLKQKWNAGGRFQYFPSIAFHPITTREEFEFDRTRLGQYVLDVGLRSSPAVLPCDLLGLAAFKFVKGLGQSSGLSLREGDQSSPCNMPGRDDRCCATANPRSGYSAMYHDEWPVQIFRYVLAHETGHNMGLCHYGHDGFHNIMYTPADEVGLSDVTWGTLWRYYRDNEPSFSLKDAKNVWRFLVQEKAHCLDPEGAPSSPILRAAPEARGEPAIR